MCKCIPNSKARSKGNGACRGVTGHGLQVRNENTQRFNTWYFVKCIRRSKGQTFEILTIKVKLTLIRK